MILSTDRSALSLSFISITKNWAGRKFHFQFFAVLSTTSFKNETGTFANL
jgi:hypothetical protein